ncbi:GAP family protein [Vibrio cholerae]|nr:GAP family protein [Vibrio cholerae]
MTPILAGLLLVLALIDSTSFGTLLIPIWLMLAPGRIRLARILVFLLTIGAFYVAVGLAVLFGAEAAIRQYGDLFASRPAHVVFFGVGAALLAWSLVLERQAKRQKVTGSAPGRLAAFRERAVGSETGGGAFPALVGLALLAGLVEVASMLPYLGAIGAITASDIPWPVSGLVLAAYCAVMVLPAVVLLLLRITAARRVDPLLQRIDRWMTRNSTNSLSWVVGIVGVVVMVHTGPAAFGGTGPV